MDPVEIQNITEKNGIIFLAYDGGFSQSLITGMIDVLEQKTFERHVDMGLSSNIFIVFIEMAQNMMNYSKEKKINSNDTFKSEGVIMVGYDESKSYYIHSQNVILAEDMQKIEPKLIEILSLDKEAIKLRYRELRKSGKNTHGKGGGIGFYEIAKRCSMIKYRFIPIDESTFFFHFHAVINQK